MSIFQNVAFAWLWRRAQELGGLGGTLVFLYVSLPDQGKDAVNQIFAGGWQNVSLGAVATIGLYVWSQVQSWHATTRSQVVTEVNGTKVQVPMKELPATTQPVVKEAAEIAVQRRPRKTLATMLGWKR